MLRPAGFGHNADDLSHQVWCALLVAATRPFFSAGPYARMRSPRSLTPGPLPLSGFAVLVSLCTILFRVHARHANFFWRGVLGPCTSVLCPHIRSGFGFFLATIPASVVDC